MRPLITVEQRATEMLTFYESVFPSFVLISKTLHAEPHQAAIMLAVFSVRGQEVMVSDCVVTHDWAITPGISFLLDMDRGDHLDALAQRLQEDGRVHMPPGDYGFSARFAWVEDRFCVNWQMNVQSAAR